MEQIKYKETGKFTEEVIKEILQVKEEKGLTAENLLEEAKDKNSSLHSFFDWDDSSAAEKWRVHTARLIINQVKIIVEDREMYAFENVTINISSQEEAPKKEYVGSVEVYSNEEYRKQIIDKAIAQAKYWKEQYKNYSELNPIFVSIDKVSKKWQKKKK